MEKVGNRSGVLIFNSPLYIAFNAQLTDYEIVKQASRNIHVHVSACLFHYHDLLDVFSRRFSQVVGSMFSVWLSP